MQYTQCPQCQSIFKVTQTQLMVADGWARCSRCSDVFNALDHFIDKTKSDPKSVDKETDDKPAKEIKSNEVDQKLYDNDESLVNDRFRSTEEHGYLAKLTETNDNEQQLSLFCPVESGKFDNPDSKLIDHKSLVNSIDHVEGASDMDRKSKSDDLQLSSIDQSKADDNSLPISRGRKKSSFLKWMFFETPQNEKNIDDHSNETNKYLPITNAEKSILSHDGGNFKLNKSGEKDSFFKRILFDDEENRVPQEILAPENPSNKTMNEEEFNTVFPQDNDSQSDRLEVEDIENEDIEDEDIENEDIENEDIENEDIEDEDIENEDIEDENIEDENIEDENIEDENIEDENIESSIYEDKTKANESDSLVAQYADNKFELVTSDVQDLIAPPFLFNHQKIKSHSDLSSQTPYLSKLEPLINSNEQNKEAAYDVTDSIDELHEVTLPNLEDSISIVNSSDSKENSASLDINTADTEDSGSVFKPLSDFKSDKSESKKNKKSYAERSFQKITRKLEKIKIQDFPNKELWGKPKRNWPLLILTALLSLFLLLQLIWSDVSSIIKSVPILCHISTCEVDLGQKDAIQVLEASFKRHPHQADKFIFETLLINYSDDIQMLPTINVLFNDVSHNIIGNRVVNLVEQPYWMVDNVTQVEPQQIIKVRIVMDPPPWGEYGYSVEVL